MSSCMSIRPVGADLFHAVRQPDRQTDRQTDMTKLIIAFSNFAKAPLKYMEFKKRRTTLKFTNLKQAVSNI
jgi:Fe-S-cluster formation regulator IscX/YfhJ